MAKINIDLSRAVKPMKPMHAGGQPPVNSACSNTFFHYLTEAGIPYSRLLSWAPNATRLEPCSVLLVEW